MIIITTPLYVTIGEAAALMRLSERSIFRLVAQGRIRAVGRGRGRRIVYASIQNFDQTESHDAAS